MSLRWKPSGEGAASAAGSQACFDLGQMLAAARVDRAVGVKRYIRSSSRPATRVRLLRDAAASLGRIASISAGRGELLEMLGDAFVRLGVAEIRNGLADGRDPR